MPSPRLYPVSMRLEGRPCLVVGGGEVASRKVRGLLAAGARVRVVAPAYPRRPAGVAWTRRRFRAADVRGAALVFACTDHPATNRRVAAVCGARAIPVNVADAPELCTFHVPAVVRRGPLLLAISTGGGSPALARRLRSRVRALLADGYAALAAEIGRLRRRALRDLPDPATRRRLLRRLAGAGVLAQLEQNGFPAAKRTLARLWSEAVR